MEDHTFALSTALGEIYCFACGDFSYGDDTDLRQSEATNTTLDCKILRKRRRLRGMELNLQPPSPDANTRSKAAKGIRLDPRRRALVAQGLFGIYNMGSTCFMSCILQVLLHTPLLRSFFLGGGHIRSFCKSVEKQRLELKRSILFASGNDNEVDEIASLQGGEFSCIACEFDELFMDWYGKEPWDLTEVILLLLNGSVSVLPGLFSIGLPLSFALCPKYSCLCLVMKKHLLAPHPLSSPLSPFLFITIE